jgi:hypothetical protein
MRPDSNPLQEKCLVFCTFTNEFDRPCMHRRRVYGAVGAIKGEVIWEENTVAR